MVKIEYLIYTLIINFIIVLFISLRYKFVLENVERKINYSSAFIIISIANVLTYFTPLKIGAIVGNPIAAKIKENIGLNKGFIVHFFEQTFEIIWELILITFIAIFFVSKKIDKESLSSIFIIALIILLIIFCIIKKDFSIKILLKFYRLFPNKIKYLVNKSNLKKEDAENILNKIQKLFTDKIFILKYILKTAPVIIITPVGLILTIKAFSLSISYFNAFTTFWVSFILGRLSGLPGGLGTREIAMSTFLINSGFSMGSAIEIVFLNRLLSFFPMMPTGIAYLLYIAKGNVNKLISIIKSQT